MDNYSDKSSEYESNSDDNFKITNCLDTDESTCDTIITELKSWTVEKNQSSQPVLHPAKLIPSMNSAEVKLNTEKKSDLCHDAAGNDLVQCSTINNNNGLSMPKKETRDCATNTEPTIGCNNRSYKSYPRYRSFGYRNLHHNRQYQHFNYYPYYQNCNYPLRFNKNNFNVHGYSQQHYNFNRYPQRPHKFINQRNFQLFNNNQFYHEMIKHKIYMLNKFIEFICRSDF